MYIVKQEENATLIHGYAVAECSPQEAAVLLRREVSKNGLGDSSQQAPARSARRGWSPRMLLLL